jgi:hypothetical protein
MNECRLARFDNDIRSNASKRRCSRTDFVVTRGKAHRCGIFAVSPDPVVDVFETSAIG